MGRFVLNLLSTYLIIAVFSSLILALAGVPYIVDMARDGRAASWVPAFTIASALTVHGWLLWKAVCAPIQDALQRHKKGKAQQDDWARPREESY